MKKKNTRKHANTALKIVRIYAVTMSILVIIFLTSSVNKSTKSQKTLAATTAVLPDPLFTPDSPWNQPIGTNVQLDPNSSTMVNAVDSRVNPTTQAFGMPLYIGTASDPTYNVHTGDSLFNSKQPIHIPNNAAASTGDDHWLFVYDTTQNLIFEMWLANKNGNTWSADTGDVYSPAGDGVLQPDGSKQSGNGGSYFGGVVNQNDATRGYINHALSLASQATLKNAGRPPMNQQTDGGNGVVPMGARFQLDPSVNCDRLSGASKGEIMICHAMQTYGGYMHDTGGVPMSIYFQEDGTTGNAWSALGLNENTALTKIPWNKMRVLKAWNSYDQVSGTSPTVTPPPSGTTGGASVSVCPHGLGNCGDNVSAASGGNTNPKHPSRTVSIAFLDANNTPVSTQQGTVTYDTTAKTFTGSVSLSGVPNGQYLATISMDGFLTKQYPGIFTVSGSTLSLPPISLVTGDINNDKQLDILDYNALISCFGSKQTSASCKYAPTSQSTGADINDDGEINAIDYNTFLRELSVQKSL